MRKIAIIPARSGSKGLPNKNILLLGDKPLIAYSIEAALDSKAFDRVIVSTDSMEYKMIAERYGAEVMLRSEELASDTASSFMVIEDVLRRVEDNYDYFVLLQPTSPFRIAEHIREALSLFEEKADEFNFLVSMTESDKASDLIQIVEEDHSLKHYQLDFSHYRRQAYKEYHPNGAIFLGKVKPYLEQKHFFSKDSLAYMMSKEDSVDIDDRLDFEMAIALMMKKNRTVTLRQSIENQIAAKTAKFDLVEDITLIGHSIMANWTIHSLKGLLVNNLGIAGISTLEYQELILDQGKISELGDYVIMTLGTNDIVDESLSDKQIVDNICHCVTSVKKINPATKILFLEMTAVAFRMDRSNEKIYRLNEKIKERLAPMVTYVPLNEAMTDEFGNLLLDYTVDGLHLSTKGYEKVEEIVGKYI